MVQHRVHQRAALVPWTGVHDHPGRLVDHQQVFVLEDDRQRQVLGDRLHWFGDLQLELDRGLGVDETSGLARGSTGDDHLAGREGPRELGARAAVAVTLERRDERGVEALAERLGSERHPKAAHQIGVLRLPIGLTTRSTIARS